jgi:broad specificity phosphatase PhoE
MESAILVRHAESELNVRGILNGDRSVPGALTELGREQARRLGGLARPDRVVTSSFERARETAAVAWPHVPRVEDADLDEIAFGRWEGAELDGYQQWAGAAGPVEAAPGGGESRAAAVARYVLAYRRVLGRPEATVALVAHGLVVRYLLLAAEGRPPQPLLEGVPPAEPFRLSRDELARAVGLLEDWLREPVWR